MSAEILNGKTLAKELRDEVTDAVKQLQTKNITPCLAIVVATEDETTAFYVRHITKAADKTGVQTKTVKLSATASEGEIGKTLTNLANDPSVHGIILQTPLPQGVYTEPLRALIPPHKDIDGANPLSAGRLYSGVDAFAPTTAMAVMEILTRYDIPVRGTHAVIVGRSLVVGKPLAHLLLAADATVTICHSKTRNLSEITGQADILVVAIGKPNFITADYIKQGAIVIDVGTNVMPDGNLVGDVEANGLHDKAGAFSPVPGGVGPVTTALLLKQTVKAATDSIRA